MNELIRITEKNGKQAVSARELHAFLESKKDFSDWIKYRIQKYSFVENVDFEVFHNFGENPSGGRPLIEYALSVDMAKEISMVEGNEKGKIARQYFIACEKKSKSIDTISRKDLAKMLLESEEEKERIAAEKQQLFFNHGRTRKTVERSGSEGPIFRSDIKQRE